MQFNNIRTAHRRVSSGRTDCKRPVLCMCVNIRYNTLVPRRMNRVVVIIAKFLYCTSRCSAPRSEPPPPRHCHTIRVCFKVTQTVCDESFTRTKIAMLVREGTNRPKWRVIDLIRYRFVTVQSGSGKSLHQRPPDRGCSTHTVDGSVFSRRKRRFRTHLQILHLCVLYMIGLQPRGPALQLNIKTGKSGFRTVSSTTLTWCTM
jgi:hypothetical protein